MAIEDETNELLSYLMNNNLSNELSIKIVNHTDCIYEFKAFLYYQIHYGLDLFKFSNIINNINNLPNLHHCFANKLSQLLIDNYQNNFKVEYVKYFTKNAPDNLISIFNSELIKVLNTKHIIMGSNLIDEIKLIAIDLNISFTKLIVALGYFSHDHRNDHEYEYENIINDLSLSEKYDLFLTFDFVIFNNIDNILGDHIFFEYMKQFIYDDSLFLQKFRSHLQNKDPYYHNCLWNFDQYILFSLFKECASKIPQTLEKLLQVAIDLACPDLLISLGEVFSKRRIYAILMSVSMNWINQSSALNNFINKYKDDPEIKKIMAFI